jgi:hypothetical protein
VLLMRLGILDLFQEAKASSKFIGGDVANITGSIMVTFNAKNNFEKGSGLGMTRLADRGFRVRGPMSQRGSRYPSLHDVSDMIVIPGRPSSEAGQGLVTTILGLSFLLN